MSESLFQALNLQRMYFWEQIRQSADEILVTEQFCGQLFFWRGGQFFSGLVFRFGCTQFGRARAHQRRFPKFVLYFLYFFCVWKPLQMASKKETRGQISHFYPCKNKGETGEVFASYLGQSLVPMFSISDTLPCSKPECDTNNYGSKIDFAVFTPIKLWDGWTKCVSLCVRSKTQPLVYF